VISIHLFDHFVNDLYLYNIKKKNKNKHKNKHKNKNKNKNKNENEKNKKFIKKNIKFNFFFFFFQLILFNIIKYTKFKISIFKLLNK